MKGRRREQLSRDRADNVIAATRPFDPRQQRIIATLRSLAKRHKKVTFGLVRRQTGCSPNTLKAAFSRAARSAGTPVYKFIWGLAGLEYDAHTGRKRNDYWKVEAHQIEAIQSLAQRKALELGVSEEEGARHMTVDDFERAGYRALLNYYFKGSPELARRKVYGVGVRAVRGEFRDWTTVVAYLKDHLRGIDLESITEDQFVSLAPGGYAILNTWGSLTWILDRSGLRPFDAFRHSAPRGYWRNPKNRIRWVKRLVHVVRGERGDRSAVPTYSDFEQRLSGLLASVGLSYPELLKEAGYEAPAQVDWSDQSARVRRIRQIVEGCGGLANVRIAHIAELASGLKDYYDRAFGHRQCRGNTSILYEILKEAGYDVTRDQCEHGLAGKRYTVSGHGHVNQSQWQAVVDDWIYALIGERHRHDVIYPGQDGNSRLNCDFVLLWPDSDDTRDGLWIEFAGMGEALPSYVARMERKRALVAKIRLRWVAIFPDDLRSDPLKVWRAIKIQASWLAHREPEALHHEAWRHLCRIPRSAAFKYAAQKVKWTEAQLVEELRARVGRYLLDSTSAPLNIAACQKDPSIRWVYLAIARRDQHRDSDWWARWLVRAGMDLEDARRASRKRQRHEHSREAVLTELVTLYRRAIMAGSYPGREPLMNGAQALRAEKAFGSRESARAAAKAILQAQLATE